MIHRELKASLERHKVFRCCIEFQTGFPPTKTKKLLKYGWHFKHIHPRNYQLLLHAALNPFLLSSVSTKEGYKEKVRSRNIDGGVNHPTSVIKCETSRVPKSVKCERTGRQTCWVRETEEAFLLPVTSKTTWSTCGGWLARIDPVYREQ